MLFLLFISIIVESSLLTISPSGLCDGALVTARGRRFCERPVRYLAGDLGKHKCLLHGAIQTQSSPAVKDTYPSYQIAFIF